MYCNKCGKGMKDNSYKFCLYCGAELSTAPAEQPPEPLAEEKSEQSKAPQKKKGKRKIAKAVIPCVAAIVAICGGLLAWMLLKNNTAKSTIANYAEVNESMINVTSSDGYDELSTEEKAEMLLSTLADLEEEGKVAADSVGYDESEKLVYYEYADGAYGGVMLEDFAEGTFGSVGANSYIASYNENGLPSQPTDTISFGIDGYPFEEENLRALVTVGVGDDWPKQTEELQQSRWNDAYLQTDVDIEPTAADYRTSLSGYNLVIIREHGFIYQNNPTISVAATPSISFYQSTSEDVLLSKEDQAYVDDLNNRRMGMYLSDGQYYYFLLPEFFAYYYGNDGLTDTIVWLSCCDGYMNDSLVEAFANCGAKAVLGCTEIVRGGYEFLMSDAVVYMLLYGNTVDEALSFAKETWGNNDSIFWSNYHLDDETDTDPAEFRYYNGGDATLVTLTEEAKNALTGYEEVIKQWINASMVDGDLEALLKTYPDEFYSKTLGISSDDYDDFLAVMDKELQETIEYMKEDAGGDYTVSVEITGDENVTDEELDGWQEHYQTYDFAVIAVKLISVELTIHVQSSSYSQTAQIPVVRIGNSWYIGDMKYLGLIDDEYY